MRSEWWVVPSPTVDNYATASGRGEKLSISEKNRGKNGKKKKVGETKNEVRGC